MEEKIKYNVGDVVQIKSKQWYWDNRDICGYILPPGYNISFNNDMANYCGGEYIIRHKWDAKDIRYGYSLIDVTHPDSEIWSFDFASYMFEPKIIKSYAAYGSKPNIEDIKIVGEKIYITYPHTKGRTTEDKLIGVWNNTVYILNTESISINKDVYSFKDSFFDNIKIFF